MRRLAVLLAAVAALAALPACDSNSEAIGLTGTWEGEIYSPTDPAAPRYPVTFRLTDTGARVTGTGFVEDLPEGRLDFAVTGGTFVDAIVNLDLQFQVPPFIGGLSGRLVDTDPGRIEGTFSGRNEANGNVEITIVARRV